MFILSNDVFMKRIRQLLYNSFYNSPQWQHRGKGNHVYDLSFSNDINRRNDDEAAPYLKPSRAMQVVAETSYAVGTALWFEEKDNLHFHKKSCLISTGHFTTCYNLLHYLDRMIANQEIMETLGETYSSRLHFLKTRLASDYEKFQADPFFLYNQMTREFDLHGKGKELKVQDIPFPANFEGIR